MISLMKVSIAQSWAMHNARPKLGRVALIERTMHAGHPEKVGLAQLCALRHNWAMTIELAGDPRFEFDLADRLRRALRVSGVSVSEMAEHLEVSRNTIGNWINGHAEPRRRDIREFAMKTGMPYEWIKDGKGSGERSPSTPGGGSSAKISEITVWNRASDSVRALNGRYRRQGGSGFDEGQKVA